MIKLGPSKQVGKMPYGSVTGFMRLGIQVHAVSRVAGLGFGVWDFRQLGFQGFS